MLKIKLILVVCKKSNIVDIMRFKVSLSDPSSGFEQ